MVKPVVNFFKAIGAFLNRSEDYMDDRVRTGKFVGDIKLLSKEVKQDTVKISKSVVAKGTHSRYFQAFLAAFDKQWQRLMTVPFLEYTASMVGDSLKLLIKYYADIFIVFAISFPSVILLLNFFQTNTILFFPAAIPVLLINLYITSSLYFVIEQKEKGVKITLWEGLKNITDRFSGISYIFLFQVSLFILISVSFAILALFFRFFFEAMAIAWSSSFIYWFIVTFIGLLLMVCLFMMTIVLHQTYFIKLFSNTSYDEGFSASWHFLRAFPLQFFFFYFFVYVLFVILIYWGVLYYFYLGLAVGLFALFHASLHMGYLLRRRFYISLPAITQKHTNNHKQLFSLIIIFGLINYALVSVVVTHQYRYITGILEQQRESYFLSRELTRYTNTIYRFTVEYPQNWNIYEWRGSSVTFYNNYTGTLAGGIWLNISIAPYVEKDFLHLYNARPGLLSLDSTTQDVWTKVSNISVQGNDGVNYTVYKVKEPYPEYQTHYIIHKDKYVYELTFTTLDKDIEGNNTALFEKVVNSFRFLD